MNFKHNKLLNIWLALTLNVLFFHPLFTTLHDNSIILQWRIKDSLELITVIILFTVLLAVLLYLIDKISNLKIHCGLLFLIFIVPFISFLVHFMQQLNLKSALIILSKYEHKNQFSVASIGAFCVVIFLILAIRHPRKLTSGITLILLIMSPLNLLAGLTLWNVRHVNSNIEINATEQFSRKGLTPKHNVIVFLFDELSYDYLYKNTSINPHYKNFYSLSTMSDNYHSAFSPGKHTLTAIPGILMDRHYDDVYMKHDHIYKINDDKEERLKIEPDNLFAIAKEKGFKTFAFGTYLPYCEMFGQYLDCGRSFSIYNYASVETHFSLLNPILTNLMIWPRLGPQGYLKNKAISAWQKKQTGQLFKKMSTTLDEKVPVFMFSHIYCLHVPYVFDRNGYYDNKNPFLQNSDNYLKGLEYTDFLLGELINKMKNNGSFEPSEVVVLSDHNYRSMFPGRENHIPLIIKKPYQQTKNDFFDLAHDEDILKNILIDNTNKR